MAWCLAGALMLAAAPGVAWAGAVEAAEAFAKGDWGGVMRACAGAAAAGDSSCQNYLGLLYSDGKGVRADPAEGARWFRRAAEAGNGTAAANLGACYETGAGVKRNLDEAEKWYRVGAERGAALGQFGLGWLIIRRDRNWEGGLPWIERAAAQGMAPAETVLGLAYEKGAGLRRNARSAAKWLDLAAYEGETEAQSELAGLYERGQGVARDLWRAYFWHQVAARDPNSGRHQADADAARRLAADLTPDERAEADEAAQRFVPRQVVPTVRRRARKRGAAKGGQAPGPRATGSGFYVRSDGMILTNNHVVAGCREMRVTENGTGVAATVVATDPERDLALLRAPHPAPAVASFRRVEDLKPGETVVAVGFPLAGLLSSDPIVTSGIVNALAGPRDNRRLIQISAAIQPGNSGGPIFDADGDVVGVAVSTMSTVRLAQITGAIPEDINFAVKGGDAKEFLAAHGVAAATAADAEKPTAAIAAQAMTLTVRLECW